jgi:hypothetical protein
VLSAAAKLGGGKAQPALQLIGYEQEVEAAIKYAFGTTFVCQVGGFLINFFTSFSSCCLLCAWCPSQLGQTCRWLDNAVETPTVFFVDVYICVQMCICPGAAAAGHRYCQEAGVCA